MAVYVDGIVGHDVSKKPAQVRRAGSHWCHLITDSDDLEELHAFAARIGMKREWFQGSDKASHPHYDLTPSRRARAVRLGALQVDRREFVRVMKEWKARHPEFTREWNARHALNPASPVTE